MNKKYTIIFGSVFILLALILVIFVVYNPLEQSQDIRNQAIVDTKAELKFKVTSSEKVGEETRVEIQANTYASSVYGIQFTGKITGYENIEDVKIIPNDEFGNFQIHHAIIEQSNNVDPYIKILVISKTVGETFAIPVNSTYESSDFETIATLVFKTKSAGIVQLLPDNQESMALERKIRYSPGMAIPPDFDPLYFRNILYDIPDLDLNFTNPGEETAYFSAQLETEDRGTPTVTVGEEKAVHVVIGNQNDGTRKIGVFSFTVSMPKSLVSKPTYEATLTPEEKVARNIDDLTGKVYEDGDNYKVVVQGISAKGMNFGDFYHVGNIVFTPLENTAGDTEIPMIIEYSTRVAYASTGDTLEETDTENNVFYGDRFVLSLQYAAVPPNPDKNIADICGAGDNGQEPDGKVSTPDYACLVVQFSPLLSIPNQTADFNEDGFVNMLDYQILVANFGIGLL